MNVLKLINIICIGSKAFCVDKNVFKIILGFKTCVPKFASDLVLCLINSAYRKQFYLADDTDFHRFFCGNL